MCKNCRVYTEEEKNIIQHVRNTQPHICFYCKKPLKINEITVDHVLPIARDGKTIESNLVLACKECNEEKSDMTLEEYMKFLEIKFKAKSSIPLESEQKKLEAMQKELGKLNVDYRVAKCEYDGMLNAISIYPVEDENSCFRLQKLQLLMWEFKSNKLKQNRLAETVKMQQDIVNLMQQQREKIINNALEEYKWMLGKLKVDTVQDLLRNRLKLSSCLKYPSDTQKVININLIVIEDNFINTSPRIKIKKISNFYKEHGHLEKAILIDANNKLLNGYEEYLLLRELGIQEAPVRINGCNNIVTNIVGDNNNVTINL